MCWCPACKADTSKVLNTIGVGYGLLANVIGRFQAFSLRYVSLRYASSTAPTLRAFNHLPQCSELEEHPEVPIQFARNVAREGLRLVNQGLLRFSLTQVPTCERGS